MIIEALKVMLFGMLGIFIVIGLIILVTVLLKKAFNKQDDSSNTQNPK